VLRQETGDIRRITLTGGAAQSAAVRAIAPAVFGLPIAFTEPFESVAVGAARQAAWALTGELPEWNVPVLGEHEPDQSEITASAELGERYLELLHQNYPETAR
jgi:xylulokinase